jgi:hypothetical protein
MTRCCLTLAVAGAVAACAPAPAPPSPDLIGSLEARLARTPDDPKISLALAEAYYGAGRFAEVLPFIGRVMGLEPDNEEAALFHAYTLDTLRRDREAREAFQSLAGRVGSGAVRRAIAVRLRLLEARLRVTDVREAVASGSWPGAGGAPFGLLPLRYAGNDTALQAVGVGLAQYMADELVRRGSGSADSVEYERVLELRHALEIGDEDLVDPATAARLGRMLRVRLMLQGTIEPVDSLTLRLRADLVDVTSGGIVATMTADTSARDLAVLGARVAANALAARDDTSLTEPVALPLRRPRVEALVAFGRGLEARTARDWPGAAAAFYLALLYDGAWTRARGARDEAALLANPPRSDPRRLAARVEGPTTHAVLRGHLQATAMAVAPVGADGTEGLSPDLQTVTGRKPVAEATGSAGPEQAARSAIQIIIRLHLLGVP